MKITTVKGTNDYLPREVELRDYIQSVILGTYKSNGFERIITPIIEDIDNIDKSEGGDNLNLIFKILKRGDKLSKAIESGVENDLTDLGLRYDLTLPLSRYYANNRNSLVSPFKCIQIDRVYRAERPQKGRLREFVQCDIDIIGTTSKYAEVELITTTAKALLALDMKGFRVKINDRRILKNTLLGMGFEESELDRVCVIFDKLDKIGAEGINNELEEGNYKKSSIDNLMNLLNMMPISIDALKNICSDNEAIDNIETIVNKVTKLSKGEYTVDFDISLVRGQGYYTGTIFEIESSEFRGAIAGGGRYDNLIGKFLNESVPAVGFSIGFERIFNILRENGYKIPDSNKRLAVFFDDNSFDEANEIADLYRKDYYVTLFEKPKKMGKFLNKLKEDNYYGFCVSDRSDEINIL